MKTTHQENQKLSKIAGEPTFRIIDGISIRFVESAPRHSDALLLSPWPESVFAYEPTWSRLAETTHLVAIDLPGFGRSEGRAALMSPRAMGDFIVGVADSFGLEHPHIVGPDVGTAAALFAAAAQPGRFPSLVVGSGGTGVPLQLGDLLRERVFAPDLEPYRRMGGRANVERVMQTLELYRLSDTAREDYLTSYKGNRYAESIRYVRSYPTELEMLRDILPHIETPVQIDCWQQRQDRPARQCRVSARTAAAQRTSSDRLRPFCLGGRRRRIWCARECLVGRRIQQVARSTGRIRMAWARFESRGCISWLGTSST